MGLYKVFNGPMPTTGAQAAVSTGTAIKTLLQIKPFNLVRVVEWGISFDGSAAATPIKCELLETDVAATVTASVDADCMKYDGVADQAVASIAGLTLGTAATGYTSSAEGSITAVRQLDCQFLPPTGPYIIQFPLGQQPILQIGKFGRIRVLAPAAVNAICYMLLQI